MNKVFLIGRFTDKAKINDANGTKVARFSLAVNRNYDREKTDFINCVAFKKNADFCEKYFEKGSKALVEGEWQTGSYTNKDGVKVYTNDCIVNHFEFVESKGDQKQQSSNSSDEMGFINIPDGLDEELPFCD